MPGVEPFATPTQIRMPSGVLIDLLDMDNSSVQLVDIAASISRQVRFLGHAPLRPTVAEHSLVVEHVAVKLLPDQYGHGIWWRPDDEGALLELRRAALMHDATEAFISDMPTPGKRALRALSPGVSAKVESTFDELEAIIAGGIERRFDCAPGEWRGLIKQADQLAYEYESNWGGWGETDPPSWLVGDPALPATYGQTDGGLRLFLSRCAQLGIK